MVSYRALDLGADVTQLGLLTSAYAVLAAAVAIPGGRFADRHGERPVMLLGVLLLGGSAVGMAWSPTLGMLAAFYALFGLGQVFEAISLQTLVATLSTRRTQDTRYGYQTAAASLGQVIGPAVGGFLAASGGRAAASTAAGVPRVFVLSGIVVAALVPLALLLPGRRPAPGPGSAQAEIRERTPLLDILRLPSMMTLMMASIATINGMDVIVAFLPAFGEAHGIPVEAIGVVLSLRAVASIASRLATGALVTRLGQARGLAYALVLTGVSIGMIPLFPNVVALGTLMILSGFGFGLCQPLTLSRIISITDRDSHATAVALRLFGNRGAQIVFPPLVGMLGTAAGLPVVFVVLGMWQAISGLSIRLPEPRDGPGERGSA